MYRYSYSINIFHKDNPDETKDHSSLLVSNENSFRYCVSILLVILTSYSTLTTWVYLQQELVIFITIIKAWLKVG